MRDNKGKIRWSLVHFKSIEPMVHALEFGADKYEPEGFKKELQDPKEVLESAIRHLTALMDGEAFDPESGIEHIGHAMANCMIYQYTIKQHELQRNTNDQ